MKRHLIALSLLFNSLAFVAVTESQWLDAYIPDFKVNDDNQNSYQTNSAIGVDTAGNFVIVWNDVRSNPGSQLPPRVNCQRYSKVGLALGSNFSIGQDTSGVGGITVLQNGRYIVLWGTSLQNYTKAGLYFQRFSKNGDILSSTINVLDTPYTTSNTIIAGSSISSAANGSFIVTWGKGTSLDTSKIYFQRYDSTGSRIGFPQRVNEAYSRVESPEIAVNNDGSFVIVWQDDRNNNQFMIFDIYMQRYDANGNKIGNNIKVNDDTGILTQQYIGNVNTDKQGYTVITWSDERLTPIIGIFYQLYDANGQTVGINRRADVSASMFSVGQPRVSMREDRKFYISWVDLTYAGKDQVFGRRFDEDGNQIGSPYMIPAASPGNSTQNENSTYLLGDRVYVSWTDNRNGGGPLNYDIYCNVRGFQNPDTVIGIINTSEIAKEYKLYPVYPNPFNPVTRIKYSIMPNAKDQISNVSLTIFDILGRENAVLINESQLSGEYTVQWNASALPSGIYFIELSINSEFKEVQKALLIK